MCGICGIRRFGPEPIDVATFNIMLLDNERRGNMATGVATQQRDGSVQVHKSDDPAWRFMKSQGYHDFVRDNFREDTLAVLGHTRLSTKGSSIYNKNNHPMWDNETAVVHNGVIFNDDQMFTALKLERAAETDSDIIRAILSSEGFTPKAVTTLNRLNGSAAFAAVSTKFPGKLLLARSGSPLELATTNDWLVWSSMRDSIHKALRPYYKRFGLWMRKARVDAGFMPMANDEAYIIGDQPRVQAGDLRDADWLEWHGKMQTTQQYTPRTYAVHETYSRYRAMHYDPDKATVLVCCNPDCGAWLAMTPEQAKRVKRLRCEKCKTMQK